MPAEGREPQYLGTHRGISRVQLGWWTLYFNGDGYTHTIGNLYGTHADPSREEINAARKVIPVTPRPPTLTHTPPTDHKDKPKRERAPRATAKEQKAKPSSAKKPRRKSKATAKEGMPAHRAPSAPPKTKQSAQKPAGTRARPATAPIATMADLQKSIEASGTQAKPINSMAQLASQLA